ncbi:GNAT family N-acetyltransferase [Aeromicrobium sp. Leaf350]|uniref:GNAT family N-acetyltransferase n=1 Tax=Aeromicrobium sp. Leaf350 TaxID=2876565 RepID=UPI001E2B3B32|nr:GNAT family N-acetyltransferase [Aeromicrobium sp. Leaf350]
MPAAVREPGGLHLVDGPDLTGADVHAVWTIRDVVFNVEQRCEDADPDAVDLRPTTSHLWLADDAGITSYLRTYVTADGVRRVGRVCTRKDARGTGLSGSLLREVLERWGDQRIDLGAQAYLHDWYAGFGFVRSGDDYVEAGIDHVPMTRQPT